MGILYFRKSGASVLRMLDSSIAQVSLPGYTKCLLVDFKNLHHVGPDTLTTLKAAAGAKGDLYLTPAYLFAYGIVPDADFIKWPDSKGGSYAEQWRTWSFLARLDVRGPVAASLGAIRDEMTASLATPASHLASGQAERARAELDALAAGDSAAVRAARFLVAPGDRRDVKKVASVLQCAVSGILAEAC